MTSKEPIKHIIEGFSDDLKSIAEIFATKYQPCSLIDFLKLWDDQELDCLFANRFDPRELIEAISEMYLCLSDVLISKDEDSEMKSVAIYLLLCIYVKQPERFRCRFRWTCQDLLTIENWINSLQRTNLNPRLAMNQLKALRAFDLVEEREIYGPSMIRRGARDSTKDRTTNSTLSSPLIEERTETIEFLDTKIEPNLYNLKKIHANYDQFRQAIQLEDYREIGEQATSSNTESLAKHIDQAIDSLAEFKSNLNNQ